MYRVLGICISRFLTGSLTAMSLLLRELDAFYLEHEYCGEFDGGVEGERVWMTCSCGAMINRHQDDRPSRRTWLNRPGQTMPLDWHGVGVSAAASRGRGSAR